VKVPPVSNASFITILWTGPWNEKETVEMVKGDEG
jgi:hypothetical protein